MARMVEFDRDARRALNRAVIVATLLVMVVGGCQINVGDLEKWRNRRGSEEKFVEWMLDPEATPEVRVKAIEMLFEQYNYEGAQHLPDVAQLPQQHRDEAIRGAMPHIKELFEGMEFSLGGEAIGRLRPDQVRDGALMLYETTETQEARDLILDEIIVPWLRDNYRPCITSVGRHPNSRILSIVGRDRGLPIVTGYVREGSMDNIVCQNSYLGNVLWVPEATEALATAYTDRWTTNRPDSYEGQRQLVIAMLNVPNSRVLKNWIFVQLVESEEPLLSDIVQAFLDYVRPYADAGDGERYAALVTRYDGDLRWMGFESAVRLRGAEGLDLALNAMPSAGIWGLWAGQNLDDGLERAIAWVCDHSLIEALGDEARLVFERHSSDANLVARAIAIVCLGKLGNAETVPLLNEQLRNESLVPSWGEENNTIGALAREATVRIESRLESE